MPHSQASVQGYYKVACRSAAALAFNHSTIHAGEAKQTAALGCAAPGHELAASLGSGNHICVLNAGWTGAEVCQGYSWTT